MILGDSLRFLVVLGISWWFLVVLGCSWWFLLVIGGSWWFLAIIGIFKCSRIFMVVSTILGGSCVFFWFLLVFCSSYSL